MKAMHMAGKALAFLLAMTLLCGGVYPLVTTGLAQLFFHKQANGDLIVIDGVNYGSEHIGQQFTQMNHLWGHPMSVDTESFADAEGNPLAYGWYPTSRPPAMSRRPSMPGALLRSERHTRK